MPIFRAFFCESVKENFVDAKLVDGTQIKVEGETLANGAKVVVVTEQGEVPAPVEKEPVEEELVSMLKDFISKMSDKIKSMESEMASVKNEFEAFKKEPSAKKIANGKTDFNKQPNSDGVDARLSAIMALRNKK